MEKKIADMTKIEKHILNFGSYDNIYLSVLN